MRKHWLAAVLLLLSLVVVGCDMPVVAPAAEVMETPADIPDTAQEGSLFSSPMPIPTATPTPPPSEEEQIVLQYVAETYGVDIENLEIGTDYELTLPLIDRSFHVFKLFDAKSFEEIRQYSILIDQATGEIEDDLNAIQAAETAAYEAKYGKLAPALYERLDTVSDDTVLPVAVWVAGSEEAPDTLEIYDILAAEFPEAAEALANHMLPMEVEDPVLAEQIIARYRELRGQGVRLGTQPVLDWFQQEGITVQDSGIAPYIHAELSKETILRLATLDAVATIYLTEVTASPEGEQSTPDEAGDVTGQKLSFETITRSDTGAIERWKGAEPKLMIITDSEAVETARTYVFEEEGEMLDAIDLTMHFAVLAFRGWYSRTQGGFRIVSITRQDNEVILIAEPGQRYNKEAESSPYHLVTIPRDSDWGKEVTFKLYFDPSQAPVAIETHYIE